MVEPAGAALPLHDSVDGEPVPLLLAESPAVVAAVEVGSQRWLLPSADGSHPEQALIVWISMDPYGEDYDVTNVMIALPGHGMEDAVLVNAYDSPPLAVRFILGDRTSLAALQPLDVAVAATLEDTFSPEAHGMIWPSASDLCRRAPGPLVTSEIFVQFSDLGPQFALQGDVVTEGFVTAEELEDLGDDDLPLVQSAAPPPSRGRGRGAASAASLRPRGRTRAASAEPGGSAARGGRGRGRSSPGQVPDVGGGPSAPPKALLDAISSTIRSELGSLTQRIEFLEHGHKAPPQAPSLSRGGPPGLDPLFGRGPGLVPDVLGAAREAQQLLRFGAGGSHAPNPFAMPSAGGPKAHPKGPPVRVGAAAKAAQAFGGLASEDLSQKAPVGASTNELLSRIASALEGSRSGAATSSDTAAGAAGSLAEYMNLLSGASGGSDQSGAGGASSRAGGLWALERIKRTRRERPDLVVEAAEAIAKEQLGVLSGEAWNWRRHVESELLPVCGNFSTLKRMLVLVAACLDEGRVYGLEQQQALLQHVYKVLEATARDPAHEMQWSWPLLGITDPAGRPRSNWAPGEAAALVAFHRDEAALEESKRKLAGGSHRADPSDRGGGDDAEPWWKRTAAAKAAAKAKAAAAKPAGGAQPKAGASSSANPSA